MASSHRSVRRDANLEKLYGRYRAPAAAPAGSKAPRTESAPVASVPVLEAGEARFVRRDLARVGLSACLTLLLIVGVWATSGQSYWGSFVRWLANQTHF